MDLSTKAREIFSQDIYASETTGIEIDEVREGLVRCHLSLDRRHVNAAGFVMGGALFTLADYCFAIASNIGGQHVVTLNSQISYLKAVKSGVIYGESTCIREGRQTAVYQIDLMDAERQLLARVITTGMKMP